MKTSNYLNWSFKINLLIVLLFASILFAASSQEHRSGLWPKVRVHQLQLHPTCAACGSTEHLTVHHVVPFHDDPSKELDEDNLITLCENPSHNCHFIFGHLLNWKSSNPNVREDAARYLKEVQNRPKEMDRGFSDSGDEDEEAIQPPIPETITIIEYGAKWCGPCKQQESILDHLIKSNSVYVIVVDVDNPPQWCNKGYKPGLIPEIQIWKSSKLTRTFNGLQTEETLRQAL